MPAARERPVLSSSGNTARKLRKNMPTLNIRKNNRLSPATRIPRAIGVVALVIFSANFFVVHAQSGMFDKASFTKSEQSSVFVHPSFNDNTTNIAFYVKCYGVDCPPVSPTATSSSFSFSAENLGHGDLPFSDYWAPPETTTSDAPSVKEYVAVEYFNDTQQFTCSDLSLDQCLNNSHFVGQFSFKIADKEVPSVTADTNNNGTTTTTF